MKYTRALKILFLVANLMLLSCTRNGGMYVRSISDSLIKVNEDIVVPGIRFGITEQQFHRQNPKAHVSLDGRAYKIIPLFSGSGRLNRVYLIDTTTVNNKKFDRALFDKLDLLKKYFADSYGEPLFDRGYPRRQNMKNANSFDSYKWEVGKKTISVGIALEQKKDSNTYYSVCHIDRK